MTLGHYKDSNQNHVDPTENEEEKNEAKISKVDKMIEEL